ncbi:MAG: GNAT family N-acetyltransferase [Desulfarculales bacterium]|jgi:hypothetical protein|nr:GNAT family N-acetyltransferase [Desulfarculales bacterium]
MDRNVHKYRGFTLSPVKDFSIFSGFSCCRPDDKDKDLDDFIHNDAENHLKNHMATTYILLLDPDLFQIPLSPLIPLGFVTLQNDSIKIKSDEYLYQSSPAVKIGRFGIENIWQKRGLGSLALTMVKQFMLTDNRTGCRYITLDAYNDGDVLKFYKKNGFSLLEKPNPKRDQVLMYFDLKSHPPKS